MTAETTASAMEIWDESPATTSARKNSAPKNTGMGIRFTAVGSVTNARPTPEPATSLTGTPCWWAM